MKKLLVCLAAGILATGTPVAALAQQKVTVDGVEATRVIIAPPLNALDSAIKTRLSTAYDNAQRDTKAYNDAQKLYYFYGARHFSPLWLKTGPDGKVAFSAAARDIIAVFKKSYLEGFRPSDYLTGAIDLSTVPTDPQSLADVETAFSAATIRYASDAMSGRIDPTSVSPNITQTPPRIDGADMLVKLARSDDPASILHGLDPTNREFVALKAELKKFYDGDVQKKIVIPSGGLIKLGETDRRVRLLRERLDLPAPKGAANVYDAKVEDAVKAFQARMGLSTDGVVGPVTLAALNGDAGVSKMDIIANMERWRWMPRDLGKFHVMVNIPEFRVSVVKNGLPTFSTRVVVGKPDKQTPEFSDKIEFVVVNPYWNVPASIATNEIVPHILANPNYLASQNMEAIYGGKVINASTVDWSQVDRASLNTLKFRQRPGRGNALGNIKFLFPNSHNVYLHDTPSKYLFSRPYRAFSHGCVRVQHPMDFASALLVSEPNLTAAKLESMFGNNERWFRLKHSIPVHLAYFTLRVEPDGTIRSYGDIYGQNKKLIALLQQ